jgi:hypothetical protein
MESRTKSKTRDNALKHGAFSSEPIIKGECPADFDQLHRDCIKDFTPSGRAEEEVVLAIAQYTWRKHRGARFYAQQAAWLQSHPDMEKLRHLEDVCAAMKQFPATEAWSFVENLPKPFRDQICEDFSPPPDDAGPDWTRRLVERIERIADEAAIAFAKKGRYPSVIAERACKLQELGGKHVILDERLDQLIDKSIRRLATLKMLKEVTSSHESRQKAPLLLT